MEYFYITLIIIVIGSIYFVLERRFRNLEGGGSDGRSEKLMLEIIDQLRTELRQGLDKNSERMVQNAEFIQQRLDVTTKQLNQQFGHVQKTVDSRIDENTKTLNQRLDSASKVIHGVKEELGKMKEMGEQVRKLQEILGSQKLRGTLGEQIMNDLISQLIPFSQYEFQYSFKNGDTVDAVIKTINGLIPIDSKFPLENFRKIHASDEEKIKETASKEFVKDVKKHINDIYKKYIRPEEGTLDFALMYVPADSVYFEVVVNNPELSNFASEKKVYIVSPSIFYSFLQIVLMTYQSQQFEDSAKNVLSLIRGIKRESEKFGTNLSVLDKHLHNARSKMDEVSSDYTKLDLKIDQMSSHDFVESGKSKKGTEEMLAEVAESKD